MKSISSAFWLALQGNNIEMTELIDLTVHQNTYRWTTSNAEIVNSGQIYSPFPGLAGKGTEEGTDLTVGNIQFSMTNSGDFTNALRTNGLDSAPVTVRRVFVNSPNMGEIYLFRGKLAEMAYDRMTISGQARNRFEGVAAKFPLFTYQDTCVWRFGSQACGFDTSSITFTGSINANSSFPILLVMPTGTITQSYSINQLSRGKITITSGVNSGHSRTIRANTGDMMALSHALPFAIDSGGCTYSIYPGCRKYLASDCVSKYNNSQNFLGFPWIPKQQYAF